MAEWLEMLATVSKVLGSIPGEVTKILPECRRLVISTSGLDFPLVQRGAAYGNVLTISDYGKSRSKFVMDHSVINMV